MAVRSTSDEYTIRVVGIYATKWLYPARDDYRRRLGFRNTRLETFEEHFKDLLPRLPRPIRSLKIRPEDIQFTAPLDMTVISADVFLFLLPSDQVVAALTVDSRTTDVSVDPTPAAEMLDEFTEDEFTIGNEDLKAFLTRIAPSGTLRYESKGPAKASQRGWTRVVRAVARWLRFRLETEPQPAPAVELAERHHIIYVSDEARLGPGTIDQLVYLRQPRFWKEFVQRKDPLELNERGHRGVVTTNVSFIQGHDGLLEDSVFLSTVQAVGTLSRFRQIWDQAYESVWQFRSEKQSDETGTQKPDDLERLVDLLGNLEFDLTFSVEFPLMRKSYHSALSEVLDLDGQSNRLSSMFTQLGGSVRSEITAITIRQSRGDEVRRNRNEFAFNLLALVGVPIGALLAFFGVSSKDVDHDESMFNWHLYQPEYIAALALGLLPLTVVVVAHGVARLRQWYARRRHEREVGRVNQPQDYRG